MDLLSGLVTCHCLSDSLVVCLHLFVLLLAHSMVYHFIKLRVNLKLGNTHCSYSSSIDSLRRFRLLQLFFDWLLYWQGYLFRRGLLWCALWVILISHWRMLDSLRCLGLILFLFLILIYGRVGSNGSRRLALLLFSFFDIFVNFNCQILTSCNTYCTLKFLKSLTPVLVVLGLKNIAREV